jgi:peptidyl-prolyl cis-trans isomerase B (cyclophilin B)
MSNRHLNIFGSIHSLILIFISFSLLICQTHACFSQVPFALPAQKDLSKIRSAIISTSQGDFLVRLYPDIAPIHVANFKYLADKKFYDNLTFHIYHTGYIIQGGDPTGTGNGGPGYSLPSEFSTKKHELGILGMSRKADDINPQRVSNGSQFHILLGDAPKMDKKYTIFGKVIDGLEILDKLRDGDTIRYIKVFVQAEKN